MHTSKIDSALFFLLSLLDQFNWLIAKNVLVSYFIAFYSNIFTNVCLHELVANWKVTYIAFDDINNDICLKEQPVGPK